MLRTEIEDMYAFHVFLEDMFESFVGNIKNIWSSFGNRQSQIPGNQASLQYYQAYWWWDKKADIKFIGRNIRQKW